MNSLSFKNSHLILFESNVTSISVSTKGSVIFGVTLAAGTAFFRFGRLGGGGLISEALRLWYNSF